MTGLRGTRALARRFHAHFWSPIADSSFLQIQTLAALQLQFSGVPSGALLQQQGVPGGTLAHEGLPAPHLLNARRQAQAQQAYK